MTENERQKLLQEVEMLEVLLDFHIKNKHRISMSEKDFED